MRISRDLAHVAQDRLQLILSLIEMGRLSDANKQILKLSNLLNDHIESKEDPNA